MFDYEDLYERIEKATRIEVRISVDAHCGHLIDISKEEAKRIVGRAECQKSNVFVQICSSSPNHLVFGPGPTMTKAPNVIEIL